jgi:hypothetical protein
MRACGASDSSSELRGVTMSVAQSCGRACAAVGIMSWLFLAGGTALVLWGLHLQTEAFPKTGSSPFAQVSATVYTRISNARVLLQSTIEPNASQNDSLSITVKGPKGVSDPWVLVVTCPHSVRGQVPLQLQGVTAQQPVEVLASVYDSSHKSVPLGCFPPPPGQKQNQAIPVVFKGQDINLTLPVLEQSPLAQSSTANTPLYVVRSKSGKDLIEKLVEVLQAPQSSCPTPGTSYGQPSGSSASCFTKVPTSATATQYSIPTSVTTAEILSNVSLSGDRIDSMFPPGQITSNDEIIWQGISGLSPSLSATSLSSAEDSSKAGFFAGLFYGLAAGLFVPFLQDFSKAWKDARRHSRRAQGGDGRAGTRPAPGPAGEALHP